MSTLGWAVLVVLVVKWTLIGGLVWTLWHDPRWPR